MSSRDETIVIPEFEGEPASVRDGAALEVRASSWLELLKWALSFPVMLGMFLVGLAFHAAKAFNLDPDVWWDLKTGQMILATHHWPTTDPFSFTVHGQPWISFEWLGDVLLSSVSRIGGLLALDFLLIAMAAAIMVALYVLGTLRCGKSKAGFLAALLLYPLVNAQFTMRPQMLGYLFLILTLIALELFRRGKKWAIWPLPALMLVWVNTHGSWIIGLGTILVYWICGLVEFRNGGVESKKWTSAERRNISLVLLLSLAAVMITPYGAELAAFPFRVASSIPVSVAYVLEWMPMPFDLLGGKIFLALVLAIFAFQTVFQFKWRLEELLLFYGGVALACLHLRFILVFVPFTMPLLATIAARWIEPYYRAKDKYVLNAALMAGLLLAMVHYFPSRATLDKRVATFFPVHAVEYLRQHSVPTPMLDSYGFGGYLIWSMGPQEKVFIDGRSEIYERGGVLAEYVQLMELKPGGLDVLRRYHIQSCLLSPQERLSVVLSSSPDWQEIYRDDTSALFVRREPQSTAETARSGE